MKTFEFFNKIFYVLSSVLILLSIYYLYVNLLVNRNLEIDNLNKLTQVQKEHEQIIELFKQCERR